MKRKRLAALGLAALLAVGSMGCGNDSKTADADNTKAEETAETEDAGKGTEEQAEGTDGEYTKIVYSYWTADKIPEEEARKSVEEAINQIYEGKNRRRGGTDALCRQRAGTEGEPGSGQRGADGYL